MGFIRAFRPLNLLLIALAQWLTYGFLAKNTTGLPNSEQWLNWSLIILILGTVFIAAGGYLINDFLNINSDVENQKGKPHSPFYRTILLVAYFLTLVLAFGCVYLLQSQLILWIFTAAAVTLLLYSLILQKLPFIGNMVIALLPTLAMFVVGQLVELDYRLFLYFGTIAFLLHWLREMVKDLEDAEGDKAAGYYTAAVVLSRSVNHLIIQMLVVLLLTVLTYWTFIITQYWFPTARYILFGYIVVAAVWPLLEMMVLTQKNTVNYSQLSRMIKWIMLWGTLMMILF